MGDLLAILATAVTALLTVAIGRSRDVEMLPVAGLSTILSAIIAVPFATHLLDPPPKGGRRSATQERC